MFLSIARPCWLPAGVVDDGLSRRLHRRHSWGAPCYGLCNPLLLPRSSRVS